MDRRNFLATCVAGSAVSMLSPSELLAGKHYEGCSFNNGKAFPVIKIEQYRICNADEIFGEQPFQQITRTLLKREAWAWLRAEDALAEFNDNLEIVKKYGIVKLSQIKDVRGHVHMVVTDTTYCTVFK